MLDASRARLVVALVRDQRKVKYVEVTAPLDPSVFKGSRGLLLYRIEPYCYTESNPSRDGSGSYPQSRRVRFGIAIWGLSTDGCDPHPARRGSMSSGERETLIPPGLVRVPRTISTRPSG